MSRTLLISILITKKKNSIFHRCYCYLRFARSSFTRVFLFLASVRKIKTLQVGALIRISYYNIGTLRTSTVYSRMRVISSWSISMQYEPS